jgi:hypothetical protein
MKWKSVVIRTDPWFERHSKYSTMFLSAVILGLVGWLDHVTGVEVVLDFLYLLPIFLVTWRLGRTAGLLMSSTCATVCVWIDQLGHPGLSFWVAVWNGIADFGIFAMFSFAVTRINRDLQEERRLNAELREALSEVKTLTGLLPICAWCKKIRDDSGHWRRIEEYISAHAEVDFTHSICPECREKVHTR